MPLNVRAEHAIPKMLTTREAAEITNVSTQFLEKMRYDGSGPSYMKFGRAVRYPFADLLAWFERSRVGVADVFSSTISSGVAAERHV
ncbi:helix-turn-helix domain-containing protein [Ponticaulis profundi]|uniref:Helix-turn-helix domain-containing protein n=1 Tax=Ponticaulis profundi TaxID=2665222 RepID=A0ABW1SES7_9PROT